jgi:hypothetical protein
MPAGSKGLALFGSSRFALPTLCYQTTSKAWTNNLHHRGSETPTVNACLYFPSVSGLRESRGRRVGRAGAVGRERNAVLLVKIAKSIQIALPT